MSLGVGVRVDGGGLHGEVVGHAEELARRVHLVSVRVNEPLRRVEVAVEVQSRHELRRVREWRDRGAERHETWVIDRAKVAAQEGEPRREGRVIRLRQ